MEQNISFIGTIKDTKHNKKIWPANRLYHINREERNEKKNTVISVLQYNNGMFTNALN